MPQAAHPPSAEGLIEQGLALARLGRLGEAEAEFRRALALDPDDVHARAGGRRRRSPSIDVRRRSIRTTSPLS